MRKWEIVKIDKNTLAIMDQGNTIATVTVSCFKSKLAALDAAKKISAVPELIFSLEEIIKQANATNLYIEPALENAIFISGEYALKKSAL